MALRGFDDYEITLGDEMRGERACIGKTLEDAERDLCIRRELLTAIENCEIEAFPNHSVVPGYVRSYARYLGMNPDRCYERFCQESGFRSPLASFGMVPDPAADRKISGAREAVGMIGGAAAGLTQSRFANSPRTRRIGAPVSFGGIFSGGALIALVGGLAYGGYALLQDIQRVGFTPLPEAPAVVADAPVIAAPETVVADAPAALPERRPDASAYDGAGPLAAVAAPSELPAPVALRRDGPISAIDPATSGVFAARAGAGRAVGASDKAPLVQASITGGASTGLPGIDARPVAVFAAVTPVAPYASGTAAAGTLATTGALGQPVPARPIVDPNKVALVAADEAWVRVRDAAGATIFEGILKPGESFDLPPRTDLPVLRAGNAGGVYLALGGVLHGPLGEAGRVVKNVSLLPADIRSEIPVAAARPEGLDATMDVLRSASASPAR